MRYKLKFSMAVLITMLLTLNSTVVWALPPFPANFYGTITIGGENIPDDTVLMAVCNSVEYATTTTSTFNGNSVYTINVPGDDPDTLVVVEGCTEGETVVFKTNGQITDQTGIWHSDTSIELNLTAPSPTPEIVTITPSTGTQGTSLSVMLEGNYTNWDNTTIANFGDGITVTLTVSDSTHASAILTLDDNATPESRTVTLTTGTEVISKVDAFRIQGKSIGIHTLLPSEMPTGGQGIPVGITFDNDVTGKGIYDFAFTLLYDTEVLSGTDIDYVGTLSEGWNIIINKDIPGEITVVGYNATPLSGQGTLIKVLFNAVGSEGTNSTLIFSEFEFNDGAIPLVTYDNVITLTDPDVTLAGQVTYYQNSHQVPSVTLQINSIFSITTDAVGIYSQTLTADSHYTVIPTKTGAVNDAISGLDASLAAQYKAKLIDLTIEQKRACDVNNDTQCGANDASSILRYLVRDSELTHPVANWGFDPPVRTYIGLPGSLNEENYTAHLLGDITANWDKNNNTRYLFQNNQNVEAFICSKEITTGDIITVPIIISDVTGLGIFGYNGKVTFDSNIVIAQDINKAHTLSQNWIVATNLEKQDTIYFAAYGLTPLENHGELLVLTFQVTGKKNQQTELELGLRFNEGQPPVETFNGQFLVTKSQFKLFLPLIIRENN